MSGKPTVMHPGLWLQCGVLTPETEPCQGHLWQGGHLCHLTGGDPLAELGSQDQEDEQLAWEVRSDFFSGQSGTTFVLMGRKEQNQSAR